MFEKLSESNKKPESYNFAQIPEIKWNQTNTEEIEHYKEFDCTELPKEA